MTEAVASVLAPVLPPSAPPYPFPDRTNAQKHAFPVFLFPVPGTGHAELSCSAHFRQYSALANSIPITAEATTHGSSTSSSSSSSSSRIRHAPHPHLRPRWTHMHATHQHAQHRLYAHAAHAISPAAPAAAAADAGSLGRGQYGGRAAGAGGAGGAFRPGGPQRLSPRAQEFSREFYALVGPGAMWCGRWGPGPAGLGARRGRQRQRRQRHKACVAGWDSLAHWHDRRVMA